ncbi:hypothetical protein [Acidithiobacillus ferrivorans]|uniref:Uncharacterized protein n=1 Tax=Acidithiobacillus ferrivorans TaxID=160808 RepID=A0A7T4WC60_9PROT|nr:hypothetical protein [Acidithiobacillus ferrivorans]QQD71907.1 hypothetical protein H2515_10770 [Acidithiobacillus ferrivorans]
MARLTLADLSPAMREQVMAQYAIAPKKAKAKKQARATLSPYADLLGDKLDTGFPGRMLREYQPV